MSYIKLNVAPVEPLTIEVSGFTKEPKTKKLTLRPFSITDEAWLGEFLDGKDLFGLEDNVSWRAVAAFLHQLYPADRTNLFNGLGASYSTDNYEHNAKVLCGLLSAEQIEPIVKMLVVLRERCLPDIKEAAAKEAAAGVKKPPTIWTATSYLFAVLWGAGLMYLILYLT